jgi:hypothetical protein
LPPRTASSSASGMLAALVLPYSARLLTTCMMPQQQQQQPDRKQGLHAENGLLREPTSVLHTITVKNRATASGVVQSCLHVVIPDTIHCSAGRPSCCAAY